MNNCLVTKQGRVINCVGGQHVAVCKREFNVTLGHFLKRLGGVRIMFGRSESVAIEFYKKPTGKQMSVIRKALKQGDYHRVSLVNNTLYNFFRPIRSIV